MSRLVEIGGVLRAIDGELARELLAMPPRTPVPGAGKAVLGLAAVRGRVLPVLDGNAGGGPPVGAATDLLLVEVAGLRAGLACRRAPDVRAAEHAAEPLDVAALLESLAGYRLAPDRPAEADEDAIPASSLAELRAVFLDEGTALLDSAERTLAGMREGTATAAPLLRALHGVKGSAGSVGLDEVATRAHRLEEIVLGWPSAPPPSAANAVSVELEHLRVELARLGRSSARREPGPRRAPGPPRPEAPARSLRVDADRLDELVADAALLVQDRARIARRLPDLERAATLFTRALAALHRADADPAANAEALGTLDEGGALLTQALGALAADVDYLTATTRALQGGLDGLRTTPAERFFAPLAAAARDIARKLGKPCVVVATGGATSIDRALVDRLAEPLLHLLRNALVHGIEPAERRRAAKKPAFGRIEIGARQRGAEILFEVSDDGAGIDRAGVRRSLVRRGLATVEEAEALDDDALVDCVFTPGVSTLDEADALAGRGVGLDAVRATLGLLGGTIRCSSTPGAGTRFSVRLPLTTAVLRALLFKVGGQVYAVPAEAVAELLPRRAPGEALDLGALLPSGAGAGGGAGDPGEGNHVVLSHDGARWAVRVDRIIGEREIVVQGLGPLLSGLPLVAGATISGADKVQLLLDVAELGRRAGA